MNRIGFFVIFFLVASLGMSLATYTHKQQPARDGQLGTINITGIHPGGNTTGNGTDGNGGANIHPGGNGDNDSGAPHIHPGGGYSL